MEGSLVLSLGLASAWFQAYLLQVFMSNLRSILVGTSSGIEPGRRVEIYEVVSGLEKTGFIVRRFADLSVQIEDILGR